MFLTAVLWTSLAMPMSDEIGHWPGWRGVNASGVSAGSPPIEWDEKKNLRWKTEIPGRGLSSPVIWGEYIFLSTAVPTGGDAETSDPPEQDQGEDGRQGGRRGRRGGFGGGFGGRNEAKEQDFFVLALHREDGRELWRTKVRTATPHEGAHRDSTFATPTLATDGEHIIASFGSNGIYGLTLGGELVWEKDLGDMRIQGTFGEGASPVMEDGMVVINWDHEGESFIVALDAESGDEAWRTERPQGTSWTTPLIVDVGGEWQVIVAGPSTISYDLASGEILWTVGDIERSSSNEGRGRGRGRGGRGGRQGFGRGGVMTTPVASDGILYVATGDRGGSLRAISLEDAEGDMTSDQLTLWAEDRDIPRIPSPVVHDGLLYALKANSGMLTVFEAETGKRVYGPERLQGVQDAYASIVVADGRLYISGRDGTVEVVAGGREFKTLAVNHFDDGFDASPAIADNELYLRGRNHLYCIAEN